ncbi:MAG: vitamin B12-dependent ribonucleotide reductase, partial [Candidatus Wallbacteria bacterium]|nr:vitamin B12-dependent ribonucleotide reductase [Candidatus Wallbacteria bacterium]
MTIHHPDVILPRKLPIQSQAGRAQKPRKKGRSAVRGLPFGRRFTRSGQHPFDEIQWEKRNATISNERGESVFQQKDVEVPAAWSQMATNVVVSKYFRGALDTPSRENSVKTLIGRVVGTIAKWAEEMSFFASHQDLEAFSDELTYLLVNQYASFNSPVWFNVGIEPKPQCSACFINSVGDTMESILGLAKTEGMLFKHGSGTGSNLSSIRSSFERLAGGGQASGPVSFMKGFDAFAGVIKSGGKTRRAAKMVILDADHPDIEQFILCKAEEEKKAWALIDAGYNGAIDGPAYGSIFFQNSNNSVRVDDDFMQALEHDGDWTTRAVTDGTPIRTFKARELIHKMAEAAHVCGDPGIQYDTNINAWHTCPTSGRINASNPCSEYMFLDDTACNLASLNLMKFVDAQGEFDPEAFGYAVKTVFTAMEILVGNASYPTPAIERNSHLFRPLGIGYANLGALLMERGLPYDSDAGRNYAAAITAVMTGESYAQSARIAAHHGTFEGYAANRDPMLGVIAKHKNAVNRIDPAHVPQPLLNAARQSWDEAFTLGQQYGYRNSQASVLAPTGTIGFMMDCDTTGVEPDIALVKYKRLVGGGMLKIVNNTVPDALRRLGYGEKQNKDIMNYLEENETIEGAPHLKTQHLPVFDCAFKPLRGSRSIHYRGHLRMMSAVQPFLSGAISKTINMPADSTVDEIQKVYIEGWKMGLKAIAIYRDGCKRTQPLNTGKESAPAAQAAKPYRRRLPDERRAITHHFEVEGHEGYITVGIHEDGTPGEIFLKMAKEGSTISGLMDNFATSVSMALQYGVPLAVLVDKFSHTRFEPSGMTRNPNIPFAKSVTDYVFRWLASKLLSPDEQHAVGVVHAKAVEETAAQSETDSPAANSKVQPHGHGSVRTGITFQSQEDAPSCADCGSILVRNASCYKCLNCGSTAGCS